MWQVLKQRFIPAQIFIVCCVIVFAFATNNWDWQKLLTVFVILEVFSLLGAWRGAAIDRKMKRKTT